MYSEIIDNNSSDEKFVHLHVHSHFSLLDGLSSPKDLVKTAKSLGFKSLAITDHGSCGGLFRFQKACKEHGIKPIIGIENYFCNDHTSKDGKIYHIILLAKNQIGIKNIMRLTTVAELKGKYKKPRIDINLLKEYHEGIICTTACSAGKVPDLLWEGNVDEAKKVALEFKSIFGDDFYIEVMKHKYYKSKDQELKEEKLVSMLISLAKEIDVKVIATNDVHYPNKKDSNYHDVLLSMQTGNIIKNPDRFSFDSDEFYMKSYDEMYEMFKDYPEVLSNTVEVANKIESSELFKFSPDLLPDFNVPEGFKSEEDYLKAIVKDGMIACGLIDKPEYRERIKFEMQTILKCKYTRYFLILWDVINYAKNNNIAIGIGRGSAVGSLTLYVLGVVGLDPIKYDLLFERFLNPERISPPDVDIDFDYDKRHLIVEYVERKYGTDHCCKIGTYQSMKAKAIVRYVVKALDLGGDWEAWNTAKKRNQSAKLDDSKLSLRLADLISKQIPEGPNVTIEDTYKTCQEFRESVDKYKGLYETLVNMEKILGSSGVHASGYVVCRDPIHEHVALRDSKGQVCCQFDGPEVEELGLLKFDFLGLKTLTVIVKTVESIKKRYGIDIDLKNLDLNERETLDLFNGKYQNMETKGIFQFESYGMTKLLKSIKIDSFDDLIACNAIYRPGPLEAGVGDLYSDYKHGRKPIKPLHPIMGQTLSKTYGLICYQEDFMKLARDLAGFSKGQCDTLRKACGKKKLDLLKQNRELFVDGCKKVNNIDKDLANKIFDQIEYFGGYGFNKCLSGDTKVLNKLDNKTYTLKELYENNIDVVLGSVINVNESSGRIIDDSDLNGCEYEVELSNGISTKCVLQHNIVSKEVDDRVVEVFSTGEKEIYEVELSNGMKIKCTLDHKFVCSDGVKHTLSDIVDNDLEILCD